LAKSASEKFPERYNTAIAYGGSETVTFEARVVGAELATTLEIRLERLGAMLMKRL